MFPIRAASVRAPLCACVNCVNCVNCATAAHLVRAMSRPRAAATKPKTRGNSQPGKLAWNMESVTFDTPPESNSFATSMPTQYAALFGAAEMREHARIVQQRGQAPAHTVIWRRTGSEVVLCVVADDRPGLLSLISDALASHALDVTAAHVFRRDRRRAPREIVSFFWVRRDPGSDLPTAIDKEEPASIAAALEELIIEQRHRDEVPRRSPTASPVVVRVYFDSRALRAGESVLVVQGPDCTGLMLAITRALFRRRAEIIASEVRTEDGAAFDRFTLAGADGLRLEPDSLADVQQEVLSAVRRLAQRMAR
jgi:UTP:GlnB (protein PII) uridylyltransferase